MEKLNFLNFGWGEVAKYSILEKLIFIILFFTVLAITILLTSGAAQLWVENNETIEETVLIEGIVGIPLTINPVFAKTQVEKDLGYLVYSSLIKKDTDGNPYGDLSINWEINEDEGYTFNLKPEAVFHDGAPVTAEDIDFTLRAMAESEAYFNLFLNINLIINSDYTITLFGDKEDIFKFAEIGIIPKHIWQKIPTNQLATYRDGGANIGSGIYKVKDRETTLDGRPTKILLESNKLTHLKMPLIKNIEFKFYETVLQLIDAYQSEQINALSGVSTLDLQFVLDGKSTVLLGDTNRVFGLLFNTREESVWSDTFLRGILASAIDRSLLDQLVFKGFANITDEFLSTYPYTKGSEEINLEPLKNTLNDFGWVLNDDSNLRVKDGEDLSVYFALPDNEELRRVAQIIANEWTKLGINTLFEELTVEEIMNLETLGKYDVLLYGYVGDNAEKLLTLWNEGGGLSNLTGFTIDEDELGEVDTEEVGVLYNRVKGLLSKSISFFTLHSPKYVYVVRNRIGGIEEIENGDAEYLIGKLGQINNPEDRFSGIADWHFK